MDKFFESNQVCVKKYKFLWLVQYLFVQPENALLSNSIIRFIGYEPWLGAVAGPNIRKPNETKDEQEDENDDDSSSSDETTTEESENEIDSEAERQVQKAIDESKKEQIKQTIPEPKVKETLTTVDTNKNIKTKQNLNKSIMTAEDQKKANKMISRFKSINLQLENAQSWCNSWSLKIKMLSRNFNPNLFELETRINLISMIVNSIGDSDTREKVEADLYNNHVDNFDLENILTYIRTLKGLDKRDRNSDLIKFLDVNTSQYERTDVKTQTLWEKYLARVDNAFGIPDRDLLRISMYYCRFKNTKYWQRLLEYFAPFNPTGYPITSDNFAGFDALINRERALEDNKNRRQNGSNSTHNNNSQRDRNNYNNSAPGEKKKYTPSNPNSTPLKCYKCGGPHGIYECPKRLEQKSKKPKPSTNFINNKLTIGPRETLFDSGANTHVFTDESWFTDLKDTTEKIDVVGGITKALGTGTVKLPVLLANGESYLFTLHDCWYVPHTHNIVSPTQLIRDNLITGYNLACSKLENTLHFETPEDPNKSYAINCYYGSTGTTCLPIIGQDKQHYTTFSVSTAVPPMVCAVHTPVSTQTQTSTTTTDNNTATTSSNDSTTTTDDTVEDDLTPTRTISTQTDVMFWHLRANHAEADSVVFLAKKFGFKFTKEALKNLESRYLHCQACRDVKLRDRSVSRRLTPQSTTTGEFLTCDHLQYSCDGVLECRYALIIVDDYSRFTWVYVGDRNQASAYLEHLVLHNARLGKQPPATIYTDEAAEFTAFTQTSMQRLGTEHVTVSARHHESTGVVERKIQTLKAHTRVALDQCQLPFMFWQYALHYAAWVTNWLPSQASNLKGKVPAEVWVDTAPHWPDYWLPFGCDVSFITGQLQTKNRLSDRTVHGVYLGMDWSRVDSSAIVLVPSLKRVTAVPFEKLWPYPLHFTLASLFNKVFKTLVPSNATVENYTVPLTRLCRNVMSQTDGDFCNPPSNLAELIEDFDPTKLDLPEFGGRVSEITVTPVVSTENESNILNRIKLKRKQKKALKRVTEKRLKLLENRAELNDNSEHFDEMTTEEESTDSSDSDDSEFIELSNQHKRPARGRPGQADQGRMHPLQDNNNKTSQPVTADDSLNPLQDNNNKTSQPVTADDSLNPPQDNFNQSLDQPVMEDHSSPPQDKNKTQEQSATIEQSSPPQDKRKSKDQSVMADQSMSPPQDKNKNKEQLRRSRRKRTLVNFAAIGNNLNPLFTPSVFAIGSTLLEDPKSYRQVLTRSDRPAWEDAIGKELENMYSNKVWEVIPFDQTKSRGILRLFFSFFTKCSDPANNMSSTYNASNPLIFPFVL